MNAMVEPLPLVPATWMTGGSLRSGWSERLEQAPHAVERQVDPLGVERQEPRQDRVYMGHAAGSSWAGFLEPGVASSHLGRAGRL